MARTIFSKRRKVKMIWHHKANNTLDPRLTWSDLVSKIQQEYEGKTPDDHVCILTSKKQIDVLPTGAYNKIIAPSYKYTHKELTNLLLCLKPTGTITFKNG